MLFISLGLVILSMLVIWKASDGFEAASSYLGRHLSDGVRGATINAVGSSLPELMTVMVTLLFYLDVDGFAFGVGTTAGSAIFNSAIIPALVILTVIFVGLAKQVGVAKKVILRDGLWLIAAEFAFIYLLAGNQLLWWHGMTLVFIYLGYIIFMFSTMSKAELKPLTEAELEAVVDAEAEEETPPPSSRLMAWLQLDLQWALFSSREIDSNARAWGLLGMAVVVISAACWLLVEATYQVGYALGVLPYFVAVILAAAATSVPDTILSMKDARAGNYDDAVSNALGSNIFDITVCIGLPLFIFGLAYGFPIEVDSASQGSVTELRALLLIFTVIAFGIYYFGAGMGIGKAIGLLSLYVAFVAYIILRAYDVSFVTGIGEALQTFIGWLS